MPRISLEPVGARWTFFKSHVSPKLSIPSFLFVAAGLYDLTAGQFSDGLPRLGDIMPWHLWVIVGLALLVLSVAEAFYRFAGKGGSKEIRTQLAVYTQQGQTIVEQCHTTAQAKETAPDKEADKWATEVFTFLQGKLGDDYAVRFDNSNGLPPRFTTLSPPHSRVEGYMKNRLARLNEFMQELANQR